MKVRDVDGVATHNGREDASPLLIKRHLGPEGATRNVPDSRCGEGRSRAILTGKGTIERVEATGDCPVRRRSPRPVRGGLRGGDLDLRFVEVHYGQEVARGLARSVAVVVQRRLIAPRAARPPDSGAAGRTIRTRIWASERPGTCCSRSAPSERSRFGRGHRRSAAQGCDGFGSGSNEGQQIVDGPQLGDQARVPLEGDARTIRM